MYDTTNMLCNITSYNYNACNVTPNNLHISRREINLINCQILPIILWWKDDDEVC